VERPLRLCIFNEVSEVRSLYDWGNSMIVPKACRPLFGLLVSVCLGFSAWAQGEGYEFLGDRTSYATDLWASHELKGFEYPVVRSACSLRYVVLTADKYDDLRNINVEEHRRDDLSYCIYEDKSGIHDTIKEICIPRGFRVTLYEDAYFKGNFVSFEWSDHAEKLYVNGSRQDRAGTKSIYSGRACASGRDIKYYGGFTGEEGRDNSGVSSIKIEFNDPTSFRVAEALSEVQSNDYRSMLGKLLQSRDEYLRDSETDSCIQARFPKTAGVLDGDLEHGFNHNWKSESIGAWYFFRGSPSCVMGQGLVEFQGWYLEDDRGDKSFAPKRCVKNHIEAYDLLMSTVQDGQKYVRYSLDREEVATYMLKEHKCTQWSAGSRGELRFIRF
jgi:hypothetical protein